MSNDRWEDHTSPHFVGTLAICNQDQGWAIRYNQLMNKVPGCYALEVDGGQKDDEEEEDEMDEGFVVP